MSLTAEDKKYINDLIDKKLESFRQSIVREVVNEVVDQISEVLNNFMQLIADRTWELEQQQKQSSKSFKQVERIVARHDKKWQKVAKVAQT